MRRGSAQQVETVDPPIPIARQRRPRDRKIQIARNASELFAARGFHAVRMDDIAEATGITARALYRHFDSKQALLLTVVLDDQQVLLNSLGTFSEPVQTDVELSAGLNRLVLASTSTDRLSLLWQREARHLEREDYELARARARQVADEFERIFLSRNSSHANPLTAQIRTWASLSLITSRGNSRDPVPSTQRALTADAIRRTLSAPVVTRAEADPVDSPGALAPSARREQLIAGAASLFRRHGYLGVSIDDIGAAVGVAGPAAYRYFESKADILVAITNRCCEWMVLEQTRALRNCSGRPDDVLEAMIQGFITIALEAPDLIAVVSNESLNLPEDAREHFSRILSGTSGEWSLWLRRADPRLTENTAQTVVGHARSMMTDLALIPHLRRHPNLREEIASAARAVLNIAQERVA